MADFHKKTYKFRFINSYMVTILFLFGMFSCGITEMSNKQKIANSVFLFEVENYMIVQIAMQTVDTATLKNIATDSTLLEHKSYFNAFCDTVALFLFKYDSIKPTVNVQNIDTMLHLSKKQIIKQLDYNFDDIEYTPILNFVSSYKRVCNYCVTNRDIITYTPDKSLDTIRLKRKKFAP